MSRNKFPPKPTYDPDTGPVYLYGLHTVRAALDNPLRESESPAGDAKRPGPPH